MTSSNRSPCKKLEVALLVILIGVPLYFILVWKNPGESHNHNRFGGNPPPIHAIVLRDSASNTRSSGGLRI